MPIPSKLQRFVEDELGRSAAMAERTVELTLEQLQQPREGMLSPAERQQYFDLVQSLKKQSQPFQREFCQALAALVRANLEGQDSEYDKPAAAPGGLALMDETRVEIDIELSGAAELIRGQADWELRELQTFTSTLAGQKHVSAETNPLRPLAYARALWQGACVVTAVPVQRVTLLRTAAGVISGQLKKAWAAACTRLEAQGVEPGMYRTVVIGPGGAVKEPTYDVTRPGALEDLLPTMPAATPSAGFGVAPAPSAPSARRGRAGATPNPAFDQALVQLEQLLLRALPAHGATAQPAPQLGEHRAALMANVPETVDRQIVELLSRLFEAVLADARLPAAFRTVMARLQVSALRVALVDPGMLETHEHPVWRLMNRIAIAAETYTQPNDPRFAALLNYCETLVGDMSREPLQDALLYRQSLTRLDAFLAEQLREQQRQSQPSVDALTQAERRDDLERQLAQRLTEQMVPVRTSATIRRFVTGTWAKVLAEAMVRFGDNNEPTTGYIKAVDELLWSLRLPDHPQSRKRLLGLLPGLLQRLRAGMALVALPEAEQRAFLDELLAVHTEALRPGKGGDEAELTPQEIVQRLRDEAVPEAPLSGQPFRDSLIDLGSMDTVPADAMSTVSGAAQDDPSRRIDLMTPGARYQVFLQGRWTRVQLLWRSPHGQFFLFAGADPSHAHSVTRRALERLSEERLIKPLEDVSLIQRAVDSLMRKLTPSP
jgi:hypothetical protein